VDQVELPAVGDQDLVPALLDHAACPGGVCPHLQRHPRWLQLPEPLLERFRACLDPPFVKAFAFAVQDEVVAELVAEVQTDDDLQQDPSKICHWPISSSGLPSP